jgi:hypothetical protein
MDGELLPGFRPRRFSIPSKRLVFPKVIGEETFHDFLLILSLLTKGLSGQEHVPFLLNVPLQASRSGELRVYLEA